MSEFIKNDKELLQAKSEPITEVNSVVIPVNNQNFRINYNPKTGVWKDLLGWDKEGKEVWKTI